MEQKKINIAEILKDCPSGMELDCTMFDGKVYFEGIDVNNPACPIKISINLVNIERLDIWGQYNTRDYAKCVIFPKGKTTWEGFQRPFKDGDVLVHTQNERFVMSIYKSSEIGIIINTHVIFRDREEGLSVGMQICCYTDSTRLATEEEKQRLFQAIKDNGYKWNAETKTLEKLVEPKFKVGNVIQDVDKYKVKITEVNLEDEYYGYKSLIAKGIGGIAFSEQDNWELVPTHKFKAGDKIVKKDNPTECWYVQGVDTNCNSDYFYYIVAKGKIANLHFKDQNEWELVPNKFDISTLKAYDKVLVRDTNEQVWVADLFSHVLDRPLGGYTFACVGHYPNQCIPYLGNEHLLGTTDDCDEFYKNWG